MKVYIYEISWKLSNKLLALAFAYLAVNIKSISVIQFQLYVLGHAWGCLGKLFVMSHVL